MGRKLHEVCVVRVSIVGSADESLGTYTVTLDLDEMNEEAIGIELAKGFRRALTPAIIEYGPKISAMWEQQTDRIEHGDPD